MGMRTRKQTSGRARGWLFVLPPVAPLTELFSQEKRSAGGRRGAAPARQAWQHPTSPFSQRRRTRRRQPLRCRRSPLRPSRLRPPLLRPFAWMPSTRGLSMPSRRCLSLAPTCGRLTGVILRRNTPKPSERSVRSPVACARRHRPRRRHHLSHPRRPRRPCSPHPCRRRQRRLRPRALRPCLLRRLCRPRRYHRRRVRTTARRVRRRSPCTLGLRLPPAPGLSAIVATPFVAFSSGTLRARGRRGKFSGTKFSIYR